MNSPNKTDTTQEEVITDEENEVNSFLQWDTSDLLDEAERRWELTEAMILPSPIIEPNMIICDFDNLRRNQFSTPVILEEDNIEEGVPEEEDEEYSQIDEFSFLGFDKVAEPCTLIPVPLYQEYPININSIIKY
ncbi:hypothetical protein Anas_11439, partial [Armadillidium nasatum]